MARANGLRDKLVGKAAEMERTEGAKAAALAQVVELEDAIHVLQYERASDAKIVVLKEARSTEWIGGLER